MTMADVVVAPRRLLKHYDDVFEELVAHGGLVWVTCGNHRFLVVNDADHVKQLLVERAEQLVKHSQLIEAGHPPKELPPYGGGISVPMFRRAQARGLGPARIPYILSAVEIAAGAETMGWRAGMSLPLMASLRRIATQSVCRSSLASRLSSAELSAAERSILWMDLPARVTSPRTRAVEALKLYGARGRLARSRLTALGARLIENADRTQRSQLAAVVAELPKFHPSTTRDDHANIVGELFYGAVAPLTQTAAWSVLCFATEPEAAANLREEWARVLPDGSRVEEAALRELRYTESFVREVTRLHPTNARIVRAAMTDTELGGEHVPKGSRVVVNVLAIHRDERFYEDATRFAPERWLDRSSKRNPFSYIAFGIGPRRCLGESLALVSVMAMLPALAGSWDFDVGRISLVTRNRAQPSERMRVRLRSR
jgi:pentalenene oxygenase